MLTTTSDFERGSAQLKTAGRPQEFVCAGDDLKDILQALTRQISAVDHRNSQVLEDMRGRLELLGRDAGVARETARPEYGSAFARIEDGVNQLADRMADTSWERDANRPEPAVSAHHNLSSFGAVAAALSTQQHRNAEFDVSAFAVQPAPTVVMTSPSASLPGDVSDPWDLDGADALAKLYESGQAGLSGMPELQSSMRGQHHFAAASSISTPIHVADISHTVDAMAGHPTNDREWLEGRFAAIASRIEQSFADNRVEQVFGDFERRLGELEMRFGTALESVATRADVEGLRIVEAYINELAVHFDQTRAHLSRLDTVEQHLGDLLHQVSDERFATLFAQQAGGPVQGSSEEDIEAVAMAVADRVASRMPQQSHLTATHSADAAIGDLQHLIEGFVAGQRDNEEHTSSMLDTMQQAMIRMLDRMDAIENAVPAYPSPQATFAPAAPPSPAAVLRPEPTFAQELGHASQSTPPADLPSYAAAQQMGAHPMSAVKEDFRSAAIADARRAARKVASQPELTADETPADGMRVRRGAPVIKATASEAASDAIGGSEKALPSAVSDTPAKSRVPLMVAGVALVAAVGLLAASVGLNRGLPFMAGGNPLRQTVQQKGALTIDNGAPGAGEQGAADADASTPGAAPNANPQRPSQATDPRARSRSIPETAVESQGETLNATVEAAMDVPARSPAAAPPMGMTLTPARSVPNDSDLARMRQQRNMQSLANQLAAVQANAPTVPASLMPNAGAAQEPDMALIVEAAKPSELPPALIGPLSLRTAASKGDPSAEFEVAARFAEGRGVSQDFKQANVWYQRSAQRGFAPAQYRLGTLFERGIGIKADVARAKIWYGRAAEQGHVKAMHNLAVLNSGRDQSADYPTAVTWFTAASERGLADSQFNLGVLHESGLGLPRDLKQAYYWLALAARNGDKEASRRRDQVRMKLEEADVTATDEAVSAWVAKPSDSAVNDARVAGEAWKARQSVGR